MRGLLKIGVDVCKHYLGWSTSPDRGPQVVQTSTDRGPRVAQTSTDRGWRGRPRTTDRGWRGRSRTEEAPWRQDLPPPGHCRHPKKRVDISNEGKREPIVRLGARRLGDRFEGSIYFGTDERGQFVMSSLFFCYRRCLICVFCSESYLWSGPISCLFLMRGWPFKG